MAIDKDRVEGSVDQMKGRVKEAAGNVTGDTKLRNEGRADQAKGKLQNFLGSIKDALRGKRG
ncbi:MAG: CsbD family protein [Beijerinckiaceae bacterium]